MFDIDSMHTHQAQSPTAVICENAALYGVTPERDEFDPRDVWDRDEAVTAIGEAFRILAENVAPDGFQLADEREHLLWGFVNALNAQVRRLDRRIDKLTPQMRDLQNAQDGSEVKARELELTTDRARHLGDRRDAFETCQPNAVMSAFCKVKVSPFVRDGGGMSLEGVLSMAEADRAVVIGQVAEKRLRQREAARRLGVSVRQVRRLLARYRDRGPAGLVSGHRGKVSNNALAAVVRRAAMDLVRERYADFGPTFAREKLVEGHGTGCRSRRCASGWLRRACGERRRGGRFGCTRAGCGGSASGTWCRSTVRRTTGSRAAVRSAR